MNKTKRGFNSNKSKDVKMTTENAMKLIENGIYNIISSRGWIEYLKFQSQFYNYSFHNTMLIMLQNPTASYIASYKKWKELGRQVRKGEVAIRILAPMIVKDRKAEENEDEKLITLFKPVPVFDVSQTEGTPLPSMEFVKKLKGDTSLYERCKEMCPFPVEEKENCDGANGYYSRSTQSITILSTLQTVHKLKTLVHEWAHGLLHDEKNNKDNSTLKAARPDRSLRELEAESTAFVVCHHFGIDTSNYSFGYLASWGGGDEEITRIKNSGKRIQEAAKIIIHGITSAAENDDNNFQNDSDIAV